MSLPRDLTDVLMALDPQIDAYMILPDKWVNLLGPEKFVAQAYVVGGDEELADGQSRVRVDIYGRGMDPTVEKADAIKRALCWDPFGSSYHFPPNGKLIDDVEIAIVPTPVPNDIEKVSLVSTTYLVSTRDW